MRQARSICHLLLALLATVASGLALAGEQRLWIAPHATDARLAEDEAPHGVIYDPSAPAGPLLIWLPGTGGKPSGGPAPFFAMARQQGYRVLALSYRTTPAVSQVCVGAVLRARPRCAAQFRQQRVWGDQPTPLIDDLAEDAIVPRLTALLQHLARTDPAGDWAQYLDGAEPRWERLMLAGHSQGGGHAAFLAQGRRVGGVLMFSGGWDHGADGDIADWYGRPSLTPADRWWASYHVDEPTAATMDRIYRRLNIPPDHISALALTVRGSNPHGEAIRNPAYLPLWQRALSPF